MLAGRKSSLFFCLFLQVSVMCKVGRSNSRNRNQKQVQGNLEGSIAVKGEYERTARLLRGFRRGSVPINSGVLVFPLANECLQLEKVRLE